MNPSFLLFRQEDTVHNRTLSGRGASSIECVDHTAGESRCTAAVILIRMACGQKKKFAPAGEVFGIDLNPLMLQHVDNQFCFVRSGCAG